MANERTVKMHVLGVKDHLPALTEERKNLANAGNVFIGNSLDICHVTFRLSSQKDVDQAIDALKKLKPCFDQ